jgi:hypothetical protein
MKKLIARLIMLTFIAGLSKAAYAQVLVDGTPMEVNATPITELVVDGVTVASPTVTLQGGRLVISTVVDPCADPESESCPGSVAFCEVNPSHLTCPGSTAFCEANPTHVSCPGSEAFCAVPGNETLPSCIVDVCAGGLTVFETLNWKSQPRKITVTTGKNGVSSKFVTSSSRTYKGYFAAAADTLSGSLTRRMWFSECPGGAPIVRSYRVSGVTKNACDVSGVEPKLSWSQESAPAYSTQCKLDPNKQYYLNYSQAKFGTGTGPTATSKMYRSASTSGTP